MSGLTNVFVMVEKLCKIQVVHSIKIISNSSACLSNERIAKLRDRFKNNLLINNKRTNYGFSDSRVNLSKLCRDW